MLSHRSPARRLSLIAALISIGCALAPAGAAAGTAKLVIQPGNEREPDTEGLVYTAAPGELNRLVLADAPSSADMLVTDAAGVTPGRGCRRVTPTDGTRVRCRTSDGSEIEGVSASLGDRDDRAEDRSSSPSLSDRPGAEIDGGPGADVMTGGNLSGGAGNDMLLALTVAGGPGSDTLTTPAKRKDDPSGLIDESGADSGSDVIRGGSGPDALSYTRRRVSVRVDLRAGSGAGARGENDRFTGVENADGGRGSDVLIGTDGPNELNGRRGSDRLTGGAGDDELWAEDRANDGSRRDRDRIVAGSGDDEIRGSAGPNVIAAGPGEDEVVGVAGNDRIATRDDSIDSVSCGSGRRDRVRADALDFTPRSCESVRRRGLARAIPLFISVSTQGGGPGVRLGCSRDGPAVCRGTVSLLLAGRLRGTQRFKVRRGAEDGGFASFPARLRPLQGKTVQVVVRSRDRRDRVRSVKRTLYVYTEG